MKILLCVIIFAVLLSTQLFAQEQSEEYNGRYQVKNLVVKSFFVDQQGVLTRWGDNELVKIDTATGRTWKWVSERTNDKKQMREYWQELVSNTTPMNEGAR
ncbi:MAG: hypothetical protein HQL29_01100 [Candidatus Omnitrophica bacterium]|nr:hypothetical protein [Candidatus Omnitrophota bacterium]